MFATLAEQAASFVTILGVVTFFVQIVVQLTKDLPGVVKLPTKLYVILVSVVLCLAGLFVYLGYSGETFYWYYLVLAVVGAFVVAYISIFGWDTLKELWDRYANRDGKK